MPTSLGAGSGWGGFAADRGERNLGGVEELGAVLSFDCSDQHAVGDAGDEIADVILSGERRHDAAIGLGGVDRGPC